MGRSTGARRPSLVRLRDWILALPRYPKRAALVIIDLLTLSAVLVAALWLRYGVIFMPPNVMTGLLLAVGPVLTTAILWRFGIYRLVTRFIGRRGNVQILAAVALSVLIWALTLFMLGQHGIPRTVVITYGLVGASAIISIRALIRTLLDATAGSRSDIRARKDAATLIYGADQVGIALLRAIQTARDRHVVGFVDSSPNLWRQYVSDLKVYPPHRIGRLIEHEKVREVLIALPGDRRQERRRVLQELERFPVSVKILPTYEDVASGQVSLNSLRAVEVGDILGRDAVTPNVDLMNRYTTGRSVLVTGAGGSIGSELVRQLAVRSPRVLVLLDISESALYTIELEIRRLFADKPDPPELKAVLGSVGDSRLLDQVVVENGIEVIYHAAAYKHVPMVEVNAFVGLDNNVFGTVVAAQAASRHGVERFVLVSSDKAVRPTNIMGASKRLAELVLQAEAVGNTSTVFTMVRFGNVLESSGSVVPLFREQIRRGGPVTVTHPDATRFFMSIPEAASLVIQAGAMAKGGEVFVLHMGEPVRIDDLARLMVRLTNLEVRDAANPEGDIEIAYVGLRPGEKLYEELLIGGAAHTETTEHPRIFKSDEPSRIRSELYHELGLLKQAMEIRDKAAVQAILTRTVEGYRAKSDNAPSPQDTLREIGTQTIH
ncbi:nucleoside-diphosphate sugar epimerase/dehydratase [Hyphomicrobium sp. CS1GBMeth3]|uniref:polysaccharide biosynthesis protein n=1 Tax=Hyphomicrobium sp. CS1GBMeth3 TaxID=1892845 RepID=UPI001FCDC67B|nr:nucleoside-diphosphate sugar epimerase/dehydratase [Hyphomicrobium sp. CS1GBMeth3]